MKEQIVLNTKLFGGNNSPFIHSKAGAKSDMHCTNWRRNGDRLHI